MLLFQEIDLIGNTRPAASSQPPGEPALLGKFLDSKVGWRKKRTTAVRQEKQLKKIFIETSEVCNETDHRAILLNHMDDLEKVLLAKLPKHSALVKSVVIVLLEFERFVSVREPANGAAWDAVRRRLETWKRDASAMDQYREADLQDLMGGEDYLPSKAELASLRQQVHEELSKISKGEVTKYREAVKMRRLLTAAILLDNFQRSGAITNVTVPEYRKMAGGVFQVSDHKSRRSYGSANLVVTDLVTYIDQYVEQARPRLVKDSTNDVLFPSADPSDDLEEVCKMFGIRKVHPTLLRKAASTAAYSGLTETERRRVANHMTHRPETAFKAYAAKNRKADAVSSVNRIREMMYGGLRRRLVRQRVVWETKRWM